MSTRRDIIATSMLALATGAMAQAAQPATQVDAELLEFLGSLDTEGEDWHEFLAARPISPQTGKAASKPVAKPVAKDTQGQPAAQQDKPRTP